MIFGLRGERHALDLRHQRGEHVCDDDGQDEGEQDCAERDRRRDHGNAPDGEEHGAAALGSRALRWELARSSFIARHGASRTTSTSGGER
jgi:hypothetical protein